MIIRCDWLKVGLIDTEQIFRLLGINFIKAYCYIEVKIIPDV